MTTTPGTTKKPVPLTIPQAARAAKCSRSFILSLLKTGTLTGQQANGPHSHWRVHMTREEVATTVAHLGKKYGYKKRTAKVHQNGHSKLGVLGGWLAIPATKRDLLVRIGQRFSEADLQLILTLPTT